MSTVRQRVKAQYIRDDKYRKVSLGIFLTGQICYAKRQRGLLKKAMEIVVMTGCELQMLIFDREGKRVSSYRSCDDFRKDFLPEVKSEECFRTQDVSQIVLTIYSIIGFFRETTQKTNRSTF